MNSTINISTKTKFLVIIISSILLLSIASLVFTVITIKDVSEENIVNYKKDVYLKKEKELKNYIQVSMKIINSFYQRSSKEKVKNEVKIHLNEQMFLLFSILEEQYKLHKTSMSEKKLKKHLLSIISSSRYGKSGYFWVNDLQAKMIMHPISQKLNEKDLYEYIDDNGKQIFKEFVEIVKKQEEGFLSYVWPKPGFEFSQEKISFVKLFKQYSWVIGTGDYLDDVTKKLQNEALKTISEIRYGKNGYFWINDISPKMLMHPILPNLNGKDLSKIEDEGGQFIFNEFVVLTTQKKEGGIVKYLWVKPEDNLISEKFSYVQLFKPWNWIIGTGAYVDDVEKKVKRMKERTNKKINTIVVISASVFMLILIIISLLTLAISSKRKDKYHQ